MRISQEEHLEANGTLLTAQQAAEKMGLSLSQLSRMRETRKMGFYKRGGRIFYAPAEVERVLQAFEVPAMRPVVSVKGAGLPQEDAR